VPAIVSGVTGDTIVPPLTVAEIVCGGGSPPIHVTVGAADEVEVTVAFVNVLLPDESLLANANVRASPSHRRNRPAR